MILGLDPMIMSTLLLSTRLWGPLYRKLTYGFQYFSVKSIQRLWNATLTFILDSESCGLVVEHSAHDRMVVGSIPMIDGSGVKAMPGWFLHPILVHSL